MSAKSRLVRLLDVPVGRSVLAAVATRKARRILDRSDVDVAYRGVWTHKVDSYVVPDGLRFQWNPSRVSKWNDQIAKYLRNAEDYWFRFYTPRPGDTIVDVGAGRGEDVLAFSQRVGPTGRVIAIEAHPASFRLLQAFCSLNNLTNVVPVNAALMDRPGSVTIETGEDWRENTVSRGQGSGTAVPAMALDALARELGLGPIAFLKMNIEGAERQALPGMERALAEMRAICVCCHDFRAERGDGEEYRTRGFVEDFLRARGFTLHDRREDGRAYVRDHIHGVRT